MRPRHGLLGSRLGSRHPQCRRSDERNRLGYVSHWISTKVLSMDWTGTVDWNLRLFVAGSGSSSLSPLRERTPVTSCRQCSYTSRYLNSSVSFDVDWHAIILNQSLIDVVFHAVEGDETSPSQPKPFWVAPFGSLRHSADDGVRLLWLDVGAEEGEVVSSLLPT